MTSAVKNVQSTLQEDFGGFGHNAAGSEHQFSIDNVPDQTGRVAVVTGGSKGIGYGCTRSLLAKDISKLYILSLSKEVVEGAYNAIKQDLGEENAKRTHWIQCDLSDWKQAANVAKEISNSTDRLDILINNAARGIMTAQLTDYGVDRHMALNHMGHVILTSHLLPLMKKTASANNKVRIVNLGSNAHEQVPKDLSFKNLEVMNSDLGPMGTYGRSKLAALLYSRYLARHLTKEHPNILANATHPGFVDTAMTDKHIHEPYPLGGYAMSAGLKPFMKDQWQGCTSTVWAATCTDKSGEYICPPVTPEPGSEMSRDEGLAEEMMKLTRDVVAEKTKSDSVDKECPMKDY